MKIMLIIPIIVWVLITMDRKFGIDGTGYFYLSYYDMSISQPTSYDFSVIELTKNDENVIPVIDQHDLLPSRNGWEVYDVPVELSMANVFTPGRDELLQGISTYVFVPNVIVEYAVYKLNYNHTDPTDGTLVASGSQNIIYSGFHLIELETSVEISSTESYSIVIRQKDREGNYYFGFSSNYSKKFYDIYNSLVKYEEQKLEFYSVAIVNEGESFIRDVGSWDDETTIIQYLSEADEPNPADIKKRLIVEDGLVIDNFPIKGYAVINKPLNIPSPTIYDEPTPTETAMNFDDEFDFDLEPTDVYDDIITVNITDYE
eukprot:jgi/Orpsp1_1/1179319/evm.model.c7180000068876.1